MENKTDVLDIDKKKYRDEATAIVIRELASVLEEHRAEFGGESSEILAQEILTGFTGTLVFSALASGIEQGKNEAEATVITQTNFKDIKARVEESVENAFRLAFMKLNPAHDPEYECKVKLLTPGFNPSAVVN